MTPSIAQNKNDGYIKVESQTPHPTKDAIKVIIPDDLAAKLLALAEVIVYNVKHVKKEPHHKNTPDAKLLQRFFNGLLGEAAIELHFGVKAINWDGTRGSLENDIPDIQGYQIGIKTVLDGYNHIIPIVNKYAQILCFLDRTLKNTVYIQGLATADILNTNQQVATIKFSDEWSPGKRTEFTGYKNLLKVDTIDDLEDYLIEKKPALPVVLSPKDFVASGENKMNSLAVKYRPATFSAICGQETTIKILEQQLKLKQYSNVYAFSGPTGVGKTTLARIFASKINNGLGTPIEIDAASNNGVDSIRAIIQNATERSIDSEYKIYIIDECQMITTAGWNAFLKCLETPPQYTIFMFCTTDLQKIPATIQNRLTQFELTKITFEDIKNRLLYICTQENFTNYTEAVDYIAKLADGGLRTAISMLEKCAYYSTDLSFSNVLKVLGNFSYQTMFSIINALVDHTPEVIITIIDNLYNSGVDLKLFIDTLLETVLDLIKFRFSSKDITQTKIPPVLVEEAMYTVGFENSPAELMQFANKLLIIKTLIKNDSMVKSIILTMLLNHRIPGC